MTIRGDYPHPITVNGYACRNCDDVAKAKRLIDPAQPEAVPPAAGTKESDGDLQRAVNFGGTLAVRNGTPEPKAVASPLGQFYDRVA